MPTEPLQPKQPGAPRPKVSISRAGKPPARQGAPKPPVVGGFKLSNKWVGIYKNRFGSFNPQINSHSFEHRDHFESGLSSPTPPKPPKSPKMGQQ